MIYEFTLAPIETVLETVFVILNGLSDSWFLSLILLAVLVRLATRPLEKYANRAVAGQAEIEAVLAPQIEAIKRELAAARRHEAITRLYKRYAYHPVYAIRSLAGLGVQLPFFIAAYFMLTGFEPLTGAVVPVLGDLGKADSLLFGGIHLMPFVMTLVNIAALVTAPGFSRRSLPQGLFVSLMFLILLYSSPMALLVYWTTSNLFSLASNFTPFVRERLGFRQSTRQFKDTYPGRSFEEYGYIFFIINLAVLVPPLGVLGSQFTFFTAHNLPGDSIILLLLAVALVPALLVCVLRWVSKRLGLVTAFDGAVLFVFLGLFLLYSVNKIGHGTFPSGWEPYLLLGIATLATVAAVAFIVQAQLLGFLSYLSLIVPLVFLNFIYLSPASTLFRQADAIAPAQAMDINDTPVFLLVFDELAGSTLQNLSGELDGLRYPGFAELAARSDYFPNALAADYHTDISVPSIVSGNLRAGGEVGLAPGENLIELFKVRDSLSAYSTVLPAEYMYKQYTNYISLASDFLTLYVHIVSHQDWIEERIGVIPQTWKNFGVFFRNENPSQSQRGVNSQVGHFVDWLDQLRHSGKNSQFNFLHIEFPHAPYNTTALGRPAWNNTAILPMLKDKENFVADQVLLNVAYHNYMQQSAYTDRLIQDLIGVLRDKELFDKSLIVVTSDHGVSYTSSGINRREPVNQDSWKNIVSVPLLVKYPNQTEGRVIPAFVSTLDISATILEVLGVASPWRSVGQSLKQLENETQTQSVELVSGYEKYFGNISTLFQESRLRKTRLFGQGSPLHTVAVNYTANTDYAALLRSSRRGSVESEASDLRVVWNGSLAAGEVTYYGTVYLEDLPVSGKIIAAVIDGEVHSVFASARSQDREGIFAFSLPENETVRSGFDVSLYEIVSEAPIRFRAIATTHLERLVEQEFQRRSVFPYDWKSSVELINGLDDSSMGEDGMVLLASDSKDPYVVFEAVSPVPMAQPIFRIRLESNRALPLNFYYQTARSPKFGGSQRQTVMIEEGSNSFYIKIPEQDVSGPFRIDIGFGGHTEVLIQAIEIRGSHNPEKLPVAAEAHQSRG